MTKTVILLILILPIFAYEEADINKMFSDLTKQKFNKIETKSLNNPFKDIDLNISQNLVNNQNVEIVDINSTTKVVPKLIAIFNDRAKIGDKWLSIGDEVFGLKIVDINFSKVILKGGEVEEILSLAPKNQVVRRSNEIW